MTMQTCLGCGAFLMPDWDTCKICGHDPAGPAPVVADAEATKGRRGRRDKAPKAAKAPKVAKDPKPARTPATAGAAATAEAAALQTAAPLAAPLPPRPLEEPPETTYAPPELEATAFDPPPAHAVPAPLEPPAAAVSVPSAAPDLAPVTVRRAADDDDDVGYEEFEPNRLPIILLVLLIVLLVGYFGIYLPTRDEGGESPLDDVPGQDLGGATTTSVAVALLEDEPHGVTVEV